MKSWVETRQPIYCLRALPKFLATELGPDSLSNSAHLIVFVDLNASLGREPLSS